MSASATPTDSSTQNASFGTLRGCLAFAAIVVNTVFWATYVILVAAVRWLLSPIAATQKPLLKAMDITIDGWVSGNRVIASALGIMQVDLSWHGAQPNRDHWYLVMSNHQSWSDILILQNTLRHRLPPLRFFTKSQLIWLPGIGIAMWLLGFPYVRRASPEQLAKNPELKNLDRQNVEAACVRFKALPTGVLNFVEGTRFTPQKHAAQAQRGQAARFETLLNPKIGGLSFVLAGMPEHIAELLDVTIVYPDKPQGMWAFLCGQPKRVQMIAEVVEIPSQLRRSQYADAERKAMADFIEARWQRKDKRLSQQAATTS